ncbi:MAG: PAS domain S-box protein [Verrucomicrobiota bacterium]
MKEAHKTPTTQIGLPPEQFAAAFPFHFALDLDLNFIQLGSTLRRICTDAQPGDAFASAFSSVRPAGEISREWIQKNSSQFFLLDHRKTHLLLRGEFIRLPGQDILLFLGSPWFTDASEIAALDLRLDDFAIHDPVADMLQVFQANKLALADAKKLADKLTAQRTELRAANERLQQQEAETKKLAIIAARTDNSVVLTDAEGKVIWVNAGFTRLTGYTLEEMVGTAPGSRLQGPETDRATVQHMHQQLSKGEGFRVEIINYTKSGRKYWIATEVQPLRDEAGKVINFMAIQSDITERKNSENLLRETNALQRAMLESAGYAIIATDTTGVIQLFNPAAERMLGYRAAETVGQITPAAFHMPEEIAARAKELTAELGREVPAGFETFIAKARLGQPDQREWTYVRKDGTHFPVLLSVTTLFAERGKITGYLGIASDLTERKHDEEILRSTVSELERFNRVMLNREQRVLELKREINEMRAAAGLPPAYPSALDPSEKSHSHT